MSADQSGPPAPRASVKAPRAGSGPKRTPRPERPDASSGDDTVVGSKGAATITAPEDVHADAKSQYYPQGKPVGIGESPSTAAVPVVDAKPAKERKARRGRRVKRVLRRIDLWSVLKLSLVVYTCIYLSVLATLAALWGLAYSSGSIDKLQSFLADVGLENFTFYGNQMFRACAAIGAIGVMAGTVITVLSTALVNLISEMTGGIRLVVIEEDVDR